MFLSTWRRRPILSGIAAALFLLLPQGVAQAAPEPAKIDQAVQADLSADDKATFMVRLKGEASLAAARRASTKDDKAAQVFQAKTAHAKTSQAALIKLLASQRAEFTPFWIVNAVQVTAGSKLAAAIAELPEVESLLPVRVHALPKPEAGRVEARTSAVEWNIDRVGAPRVWNELGSRGEGIVVGTIDTGADYTHPEIAAQYRGRNPDGGYDHNYNWFDPAGVCPSAAPCDNNDHGTHVMGTIAGANGIGVAPGVRWIAAKGCETDTCTDASLLAAGQWMLAPRDLNDGNPRTDLAPDIVSNSWGGRGFDPGTRRSSTRGWRRASSPCSPTATRVPRAAPAVRPGSTWPATAWAASTSTTRCTPAPARARGRTARSSRTSPPPP